MIESAQALFYFILNQKDTAKWYFPACCSFDKNEN
jgi:hypothetical protein